MQHPSFETPAPAWGKIVEAFDKNQHFLVTTHVNPDGDGLGAELGLWAYLQSRGKNARIVNPDALAPRYEFLEEEGDYEVYEPETHDAVIKEAQVVVVLDISRWERLAALGEKLRTSKVQKICIDHHPFEPNGMADLYAVDISAAATGQLVYEMIRDLGHEVDRKMALGFYLSILTDTGSFRFSNSDARAHRAAGELIEKGLDPNELYERVYGNSSLQRMRLLGEALTTMRVEDGGRILLIVLSREQVERTGAIPSDTEGFVDIARTVKGCEGLGLLMERKDGTVKVSLRSRGQINVNRVATAFDGGGHALASGATIPGPLDEAADRVLDGLRDEIAMLDEPRSNSS
jgi:phosphoesterase RecJ-like protein